MKANYDPKDIAIAYLTAKNRFLNNERIKDGLTNLYNHKYFKNSLENEVERSERYRNHLSLLMIDVDNFKMYNDANGHPAGDKLLQDIASAIKKNTRKIDLVARYGGEEFAVILPSTPKTLKTRRKNLEKVGERLLDSIRNMDHGTITISIGAATYQKGENLAWLIKRADKALYKAKHKGKNQLVIL